MVFVPAVSACGCLTDLAGWVDAGSVGGQPAPEVTGSGIGGAATNGGVGAISGGLPCDILQNNGNPCVAAHSTVRVLVSGYTGPLYQVKRNSDDTTQDIDVVNGYADAAAQDAFCTNDPCLITTIYDQSGNGNDLTPAPGGGNKPTADSPANAIDLLTTINAHAVYGIRIKPGIGYRKLIGNGTAKGDAPQTIYMVSSQQNLVDGCCFDYGNAETDAHDDDNGTAESVYFGMGVIWGTGSGNGPWVMADLENGLYAGWENHQDRNISTNTPLAYDFTTAMLVGDTADKNGGKGRFALYGGDATSGTLTTLYDGIRPEKTGYVPMQKQGSIVLGIAGDNSDADGGCFYEGVMANGAATKQVLDALQANIVAAGYGQ